MGKASRLRRTRAEAINRARDPKPLPRMDVPQMFDPDPHRNRGVDGIATENSTPEWDSRLIATLVELGCPQWLAEQLRTYPPARYEAFKVYCWVALAAEGDGEAIEKVDYYRWYFADNRYRWLAEELGATGGLGASELVLSPGVR